MRKQMKFALVLLCAGALVAGCGDKTENNENATATVAPGTNNENADGRPAGTVKAVTYKGVEYAKFDTEVTDDEVQQRLDAFVKLHAEFTEITDRDDVQNGDIANIDYTGYMDDVAFNGGADTDFNLTIGSHSFIDGFEEGLIGAKVGTTVDVNVTFPDPYVNNPDFSGKPATFKVKINKIGYKAEVELSDELVANNTDYKTVAEYTDYLREAIESQKKSTAESNMKSEVMRSVIDSAQIEDMDEEDIKRYFNSSTEYYAQIQTYYQQMYGYTPETFRKLFFNCNSEQEYYSAMMFNAQQEVKKSIILYYIAEQENFAITDAERAESVEKYAKNYGYTAEQFKEKMTDEQIDWLIRLEKAEQLIYSSAVAK